LGRTVTPWLAGGKVSTSSATALTVVRGRSIVQGGLDQSSKVIELHGGFARFIFHPSRHTKSGKSRRLHDVRDDICYMYQGVKQRMSHENRVEQKVQIG
jgi:hypothetical protein